MLILTVDLAAKFSAAMVTDKDGKVHFEFDSLGLSAFLFASKLKDAIVQFKVGFIIIEDVPYGISSQAMVKPVLRTQGIIIRELMEYLDKIYFVNPSTWQKEYRGVARGKPAERVEAAELHATRLGYTAPDLVGEYIKSLPEGTRVLKKNTNPLEKVRTDYVDARLMGDWSHNRNGDFNISGVQPVFI